MTIRKYLGCDGPECISNLEVSLESPLRDILPGNWTAIMIPGDQKQDYHFCSDECLAKFCIARFLKSDEDDNASGDREPKEPKPSGDLDSAAVKPIAGWIDELLRQAMVGPYNPPKTYTYTWPNPYGVGGARWDASPYLNGGVTIYNQGAAGNWFGGWGDWYRQARDTAGTVLR